jgi:hypothetical protein
MRAHDARGLTVSDLHPCFVDSHADIFGLFFRKDGCLCSPFASIDE